MPRAGDVLDMYSPENCRWATWEQQTANRRPSFYPAGLRSALERSDPRALEILAEFGYVLKG